LISNYLKRERTDPKVVSIPPKRKRNIFKGGRSRKRRKIHSDNNGPKVKIARKSDPPKLVSLEIDGIGSKTIDLQNVSYCL